MRIALIGSDYEENLGLGMVAAALLQARHRVRVLPFNEVEQLDEVVERVLADRPRLVGLGVQFQHRAHEFLRLARRLREAGYEGHVTCGGHFPTLAYDEVLRSEPAIDSIVLHEGELTAIELAEALHSGRALDQVAGLALRATDGAPHRTAPRAPLHQLDELPFPARYRPHTRQLEIPFIPMSGSRGCWNDCAFCSITSFHRDAREYGGQRRLRFRSPHNVAAEMAACWHTEGGPCIFCFHDETLLLPRPEATLERLHAIRAELDAFGVGKIGLIGKCRPDCLTPELAHELAALGMIRLYVGVENASEAGQRHLRRNTRSEDLVRALDAAHEAGIFACYNLLMFEPDATLDDVRENIAFMRTHAHHPVNFCRAEPYHGTPLHRTITERGIAFGCFLGWDYRIHDDRTELMHRICASAFHQRNFDPQGVANRYMGLGYQAKILRNFHDGSTPAARALSDRTAALTRQITEDTADLLDLALELAARLHHSDRDQIERETARLGLRVCAHDRVHHAELDRLSLDIDRYVASRLRPRAERGPLPGRLREVLQGLTVASCVLATVQACGGDTTSRTRGGTGGTGGQVVDPPPPTGGTGGYVVDPPPWTGGFGGSDPLPWTGGVGGADPVPWTGGYGGTGGWMGDGGTGAIDYVGGSGGYVVDSLPQTGGMAGTAGAAGQPATGGIGAYFPDPPPAAGGVGQLDVIEQWRQSGPRRAIRSDDLPLFDPPAVRISAVRRECAVAAHVMCSDPSVSVVWEGDGAIETRGGEVRWQPESDDDQLRVAVRSRGGVAVCSIRAGDVAEG